MKRSILVAVVLAVVGCGDGGEQGAGTDVGYGTSSTGPRCPDGWSLAGADACVRRDLCWIETDHLALVDGAWVVDRSTRTSVAAGTVGCQ